MSEDLTMLSMGVSKKDIIQVGENIWISLYRKPGPGPYTISIIAPRATKIFRTKNIPEKLKLFDLKPEVILP